MSITRVNTNLAALNVTRNLNLVGTRMSRSLERLSSGLRINRAGDDAAGLAISEKMRSQIRGMHQAIRNAQDGISLIQTAEGALGEVHNLLQRIRELAVQAANGIYTDQELAAIQDEIDELVAEIERIAEHTEFNTRKLLDGSVDSFDLQVGPNAGQVITIEMFALELEDINDPGEGDPPGGEDPPGGDPPGGPDPPGHGGTPPGHGGTPPGQGGDPPGNGGDPPGQGGENPGNGGLPPGHGGVPPGQAKKKLPIGGIDVTDPSPGRSPISAVDEAIAAVSAGRAQLGAYQNRLESTIANLGVSVENLIAAESRIRDADIASEMVEFTRNTILLQAGTAVLAQANLMPRSILALLG